MCFVVLYRVIRHGRSGVWRNVALALVMLLMIANAGWNWAFFGIQDLFVSFLVLVPYNAVVIALLVTVVRVDRVAMLALLPYDMLARTKDLDAVQRYLGHRDRRSTELYAKVQDAALIEIARRPCLHPACSEKTVENPFMNQGLMASPTGLEPVLPP